MAKKSKISKKVKSFIKDLAERALKTFCQVLVGFIGAGVAFGEVDWGHALSVAGVAAIVSILTSVASYKIGDEGTASMVKEN